MKKTAVAYIKTNQSSGKKEQEAICHLWAENLGYEITEVLSDDEGRSQRDELLRKIAAGEIQTVVAQVESRYDRDPVVLKGIVDTAVQHGVSLFTTDGQELTSDYCRSLIAMRAGMPEVIQRLFPYRQELEAMLTPPTYDESDSARERQKKLATFMGELSALLMGAGDLLERILESHRKTFGPDENEDENGLDAELGGERDTLQYLAGSLRLAETYAGRYQEGIDRLYPAGS